MEHEHEFISASVCKSTLFSLCEQKNTKLSISGFKIKFQNQNVALQLIMRSLHYSNEFLLAFSLTTIQISFCKTDVVFVRFCVCHIRQAFKNKSTVPGLTTKESVRAADHPDEAIKFPKQIQSAFSSCIPPSMTMKLFH